MGAKAISVGSARPDLLLVPIDAGSGLGSHKVWYGVCSAAVAVTCKLRARQRYGFRGLDRECDPGIERMRKP